jgi:hypothetical protein
MPRVGTDKTNKLPAIVTLNCIAILSGCGNGLSFGKGTYSNNSLSKASRASGISIDATRVAAEQAELKRFCDLTGRRPARITFALAHSLDTNQLIAAVNKEGSVTPDERDEKVAKAALKRLAPELEALQNGLDQVKEINTVALSKSPEWPGTEVKLEALRLTNNEAVQLTSSGLEIPREDALEMPEFTLLKNLNDMTGSALLEDILQPLMLSLNSTQGALPYSSLLQQEGNRTKNSPTTSPFFDTNKVVILVVAKSAPGPSPQDIALGRSLFGEKNFYVVYTEQAASESALLLKKADTSVVNEENQPTSAKGNNIKSDKLQQAKDDTADLEARLSDRRYSFTASEILAEARNLPADQQDSDSAALNLELSKVVDQVLSCPSN